jgi:hypothetical protein
MFHVLGRRKPRRVGRCFGKHLPSAHRAQVSVNSNIACSRNTLSDTLYSVSLLLYTKSACMDAVMLDRMAFSSFSTGVAEAVRVDVKPTCSTERILGQ